MRVNFLKGLCHRFGYGQEVAKQFCCEPSGGRQQHIAGTRHRDFPPGSGKGGISGLPPGLFNAVRDPR